MKTRSLFCATALLACIPMAQGATYYVATTGNDNNAGTLSAPFRTIGKGTSRLAAGDTLYVRGGTYKEAVTLWQSGTAGAPIKLAAYAGEAPVVDGQGVSVGQWMGLISLMGNYLDVTGFEVKNSSQRGIEIYGNFNAAHQMNVHDVQQNGILIEADNCLVEDSQVWNSAMSNYNSAGNGMWAGGLSAARGADGIASQNIMRRNIVHDNWGEGLSTFEANGTVIEDNVVYNNYSVNMYISDARIVTVQRNIVYNAANPPLRNGNPGSGITLADEVASKPRSSGNVIINNLLKDVGICGMCWSLVSGATLDNTLIAHNTIVNGGVATGTFTGTTQVLNNLPNASVVGGTQIAAAYFTPKSPTAATRLSAVTTDFFDYTRSSPTTLGAIDKNAAAAPPDTTAPSATNLALNKTAVASTAEGTNFAASNAFDGNATTRWSSQFADPQWVYVDLGANYNVNQVKLTWESAYAKSFMVQVSTDKTNWTTIYSTSASTGGIQDLTGLMGVGRYVRMYGQSRATVWGYSLWEMEVYGTLASTTAATTNIALNKTATASSVQGTTYSAPYAFDGKTTTRWSSKFADPQWVQVDLGAKYNVSRVKLLWEAAYAASYKIQVSNDGSTWTDIYSTTSGKGGSVDLTSVTGVGRYVRMYGLSRGTPWGYSLWEMEVYGSPWQ